MVLRYIKRNKARRSTITFSFIIMVEAFGSYIKKVQIEGNIKGITMTENVPNIIHQQFADDTILPGEITLEEV